MGLADRMYMMLSLDISYISMTCCYHGQCCFLCLYRVLTFILSACYLRAHNFKVSSRDEYQSFILFSLYNLFQFLLIFLSYSLFQFFLTSLLSPYISRSLFSFSFSLFLCYHAFTKSLSMSPHSPNLNIFIFLSFSFSLSSSHL